MSAGSHPSAADEYMDVFGRKWPESKLDSLLAQPRVISRVMAAARIGLLANGSLHCARVWSWGEQRYRRQESVALFELLVIRFLETGGAKTLRRLDRR